MKAWMAETTRLSLLTQLIAAAALLSSIVISGAEAKDGPTKVRGAHEGMAADEKTDDLGITVPPAPVSHPGRRYPATNEFPTGPEVGERLPEFSLPNQSGEIIDFHKDRSDSKAIVVFYRSVVW